MLRFVAIAGALVLAGAQEACLSLKNADACKTAFDQTLSESCVWCVAGAVPSECVPASWSKKLPPGVFECGAAVPKDAFAAELTAEADPPKTGMGFGLNPMIREHAESTGALREVMNKAPRLFDRWAEAHGKRYGDDAERARRFTNFRATLLEVAAHELRGKRSYSLAINEFADMSWDEFKVTHLMESQNCSATRRGSARQLDNYLVRAAATSAAAGGAADRMAARVADAVEMSASAPTAGAGGGIGGRYYGLPAAVDWREQGAVSPVKNQGSCGSCWTFSTTGCLESHHFLKTGEMVSLSEQQLVDCAQDFDNHGCNGGLPSHAFEYIRYTGGLDTEEAYPYFAKDNACKYDSLGVGATVQAAVNITYQDENELQAAIAFVGPVSIAFQVTSDFKSYAGGVYDNPTCGSLPDEVNHAVLAVGYGTDEGGKNGGGDYWIVKNSWGATWGTGGFFKLRRGKNMCGVADCASFPVV